MADMLLADNSMQKSLGVYKDSSQTQDRTIAYKTLYTTLNEYYFNFRKNNINYMSLYQGNISVHTHIMTKEKLPSEIKNDLIKRAEEGKGKTLWVTDYSQEYGLFMVKNIRRSQFLKLDSIGNLIVNIDINQLMNSFTSSSRLNEKAVYILYQNGHFIYNSSALPSDQALLQGFDSRYGRVNLESNNYFYVKRSVPDLGWDFVCMIPYNDIVESLQVSFYLCIVITLGAMALAMALSSALIDSITRHFNILLLKMNNLADGQNQQLTIRYDYKERFDEVGILHTRFDQMVLAVNELIRTNYLNEILKKEAQLKALENQMNPHFLYNTLESINWRAKALGARDISSMAEALGTLLRITLDQKSKQVTLRRELEMVQCYMTIQKYRYEDRLEYQVMVPPELLDLSVLKLTLQPLVENAIRYGLEENTEGCQIRIIAAITDGVLSVSVMNNGSQFEDNLLEKLRYHQITPHGFGIGLLNIQERMKLTYGSAGSLSLYNEKEQAVAKLSFPLSSDQEEDGCQKGEISC